MVASFDTAIGYTKTAHGYDPIRNSNGNIYAHFAYPHEFLAHCRWQGHWNRKYIDFEEYIIDPRRLSDDANLAERYDRVNTGGQRSQSVHVAEPDAVIVGMAGDRTHFIVAIGEIEAVGLAFSDDGGRQFYEVASANTRRVFSSSRRRLRWWCR